MRNPWRPTHVQDKASAVPLPVVTFATAFGDAALTLSKIDGALCCAYDVVNSEPLLLRTCLTHDGQNPPLSRR